MKVIIGQVVNINNISMGVVLLLLALLKERQPNTKIGAVGLLIESANVRSLAASLTIVAPTAGLGILIDQILARRSLVLRNKPSLFYTYFD